MIIGIRLSDTCKQGRRHTHVIETAVYHTTSLHGDKDGLCFYRLPLSDSLPSSLASCDISARATLPKRLWKTPFTHRRYFFDWPNFVFQRLRVCVWMRWPLINFPPSVVMETPAEPGILTSSCNPSLHHYLTLVPLFVFSLQNRDFSWVLKCSTNFHFWMNKHSWLSHPEPLSFWGSGFTLHAKLMHLL